MRKLQIAGIALVALFAVGCGIGNAPEPMAAEDVKGELEKLSPEQQIEWVNRSPMSAADKQKRIDEIKAKTGYQGDAGASGSSGAPSVPGSGG